MKRPILLKAIYLTVAAAILLIGSTARTQSAETSKMTTDSGYYHPLILAPADAGGGGGVDASESAQSAGPSDSETLAKAAQNPVAKMISVPFQNNFNFGIGPNNAMQYVLNFQPVVPFSLNKDWNLITRTILPTIDMPSPAPGIRSAFGLGDLNPTLFFSPAKPGKFMWGVGPTFTFPTATDPMLGNGKWSTGPAAVGVYTSGPWVVGTLANNQWSFAGWGTEDVNALFIQPFIHYNFKQGWYLTMAPIITADWKASHENRWTVPVGGGIAKILKLGQLPVNAQLAAYYNVITPRDFGADWQLRFQFQLLFPKRPNAH
jgi:hypothetical protein